VATAIVIQAVRQAAIAGRHDDDRLRAGDHVKIDDLPEMFPSGSRWRTRNEGT